MSHRGLASDFGGIGQSMWQVSWIRVRVLGSYCKTEPCNLGTGKQEHNLANTSSFIVVVRVSDAYIRVRIVACLDLGSTGRRVPWAAGEDGRGLTRPGLLRASRVSLEDFGWTHDMQQVVWQPFRLGFVNPSTSRAWDFKKLSCMRHLQCCPVHPKGRRGIAPSWELESQIEVCHGATVPKALARLQRD